MIGKAQYKIRRLASLLLGVFSLLLLTTFAHELHHASKYLPLHHDCSAHPASHQVGVHIDQDCRMCDMGFFPSFVSGATIQPNHILGVIRELAPPCIADCLPTLKTHTPPLRGPPQA